MKVWVSGTVTLIPFSLRNLGKFIYLNQENSICDLLVLPQLSIDHGIGFNFECSFSCKFSRVELSIIYGGTRAHWQ